MNSLCEACNMSETYCRCVESSITGEDAPIRAQYEFEPLPLGGILIIDDEVKEIRTTSETGGEKGVKLERYDLIPVRPLEALAQRYGHGAEKYDERNWERGYEWSKSYAALQRHLAAFWRGEDQDEETPGTHLSAAAFHIFALMQFSDPRNPEYKRFDDRPHEGEYADGERI